MRSKLHLSDAEIMSKSWIALNMELMDYPSIDYSSKKKIKVDVEGTNEMLTKMFGKK